MSSEYLGFQHSLRLKDKKHTSYGTLVILVLFVGVVLSLFTVSAFVSASPGPAASSISLTGVVPENPPQVAATINPPPGLSIVNTNPTSISGSCPINTIVEIFTNKIFAGATPCSSNGTYSLQISLLYGVNSITAFDYDALNQSGPMSNQITLTYNAQAPVQDLLSNINFTGTQLLLNTQAIYRGTFPGQTLYLPINILGGVPPFAINVEWGDNHNQIIPANSNTTINANHVYFTPGTYKVTIQATDSQGHISFLDIAVIVNGTASSANSTGSSSSGSAGGTTTTGLTSKLVVLWPLYAVLITLVVSFWLGEKRARKVISKNMQYPIKLGHV